MPQSAMGQCSLETAATLPVSMTLTPFQDHNDRGEREAQKTSISLFECESAGRIVLLFSFSCLFLCALNIIYVVVIIDFDIICQLFVCLSVSVVLSLTSLLICHWHHEHEKQHSSTKNI